MIYGLWLSATGMMTSAYRQDVIANNIANSETVGFKKDLALIQQRNTESQERSQSGRSSAGASAGDPVLQNLGGGMFATPTLIDASQGELEQTGNNLDLALDGKGYFAVQSGNQVQLTRNGQMVLNRDGRLTLSNDAGQAVLDVNQAPIRLQSTLPVTVDRTGIITQDGKIVGRIGRFDVADPKQLQKEGGTLMSVKDNSPLQPADTEIKSQFVERSNVEPAEALTELIQTQRQLEANANMIHFQDQTLDKLINDVGKIS